VTFAVLIASSAVAQEAITVWYAGNFQDHMNLVNGELVPAFEAAHPDIDVTVEFIPWGDLTAKLNTAFATGTVPDVFMHGQAATAGLVAAGRLAPLDPYLESFDYTDFGPTFEQGTVAGQHYLAPVYGSGNLLVYRTDLWEEAGLDPAKPPTTWDELLDIARTLTVRDGSGTIERAGLLMGSAGTAVQQPFSSFLWQAGGAWFSDDGTEVVFDSPAAVKAVEFLQQLFDPATGVTRLGENIGASPVNPLVTGQAAMMFGSMEMVAGLKTTNPDTFELLAVAPPTSDVAQATFYSFAGFFISADSDNQDQAWDYIEFSLSPEWLEAFNRAANSLPPRSSLAGADFLAGSPALQAYSDNIQYAHGNPNVPVWVQARDITAAHLEAAVYGRETAEAAVSAIQVEIEALLND
ncbi:MAG TPA: ABC transporter substrate-binding protein, partial [Trueperaceae bacterium]|nr:ABC transporter substrate-binding protein [Trueperaceae bacterium]